MRGRRGTITDGQLRQVAANRRRAQRCKSLAELVDSMPIRQWERQAVRRGALVKLLEAQLGTELLGRMTIGPVRRGVLTLELPDPGQAYLCQYRYSMSLRQALRTELPAAGIVDVRFRARHGEAD